MKRDWNLLCLFIQYISYFIFICLSVINICIMIHINTILRVLFQKGLMLPQLQLQSVFEQGAKTVVAWYKIVVPYESVSLLSLHITFCKMCSSLLCTKIWHQIVLVAVLMCLLHRQHCGLMTESRFSLEIISSIYKCLFQHYSAPFSQLLHVFHIQFETGVIFAYFKGRIFFYFGCSANFLWEPFSFLVVLRFLSISEAFSFS